MTGFLPDTLLDAVGSKSPEAASESFGLVAVILLIILMTEHEAFGSVALGRERSVALRALVRPLLIILVLIVSVRLAAVVS